MPQLTQTELRTGNLDNLPGGKCVGLLLERGLVSHDDIEKAIQDPDQPKDKILSAKLISLGLISEKSHMSLLRESARQLLFGELMCELGFIKLAQLEKAVAEIEFHPNKRMGEIMLGLGFISERQLVHALSFLLR